MTALLMLTLCVVAMAQDPIRVDVEVVQVHATVTDPRGRFVTNLKPANFQIFEDGKSQKVDAFTADDSPLSIGFVFDRADAAAKLLALEFLKAGNLLNEYFIVEFDTEARVVEDYTRDPRRLAQYESTVVKHPDNAAIDAIYLGLDKLRSGKNPRRVLLVFTPGGLLKSRHSSSEARTLARQLDVQVFGIASTPPDVRGVVKGTESGLDVMNLVGGQYFGAALGADAVDTTRKIAVALRNQYSIGYRSTNTQRDGKYRRFTVKLAIDGNPDLLVHTRDGYYAPGPEGGLQ